MKCDSGTLGNIMEFGLLHVNFEHESNMKNYTDMEKCSIALGPINPFGPAYYPYDLNCNYM